MLINQNLDWLEFKPNRLILQTLIFNIKEIQYMNFEKYLVRDTLITHTPSSGITLDVFNHSYKGNPVSCR